MNDLVDVKILGKQLTIKAKTLYMWAATGQIPSVTLNGLVRFDPEEVQKWIEANKKAKDDASQETIDRRRKKWRRN